MPLTRLLLGVISTLIFAFVAVAAPSQASAQELDFAFWRGRPHVGALAGLAFPRPLSVEGFVGLGRRSMVGLEYGVLPPVTISGVRGSLWDIAGDVRVFPFRGPFFFGLRAGVQHLGASGSVAPFATPLPLNASVEVTTWFFNPRVGVLWTSDSGVTLGIDAGLQVPIATSQTINAPFLARIPPQLLALIPPQVMTSALERVSSVTDPLGRRPLPTFDLLQVGYTY
ncbi:MAG: hypothetical protein FWD17_13185 [Polyangiaceae bacterium]|nr:hypothetical protein [Polyangiaceae bacterium]